MKAYNRDIAETLRVQDGMAVSARYIQRQIKCSNAEAIRLMLKSRDVPATVTPTRPKHINCRCAQPPKLTDAEAARLLAAFREQFPDLKASWDDDTKG